MPKQPTKRPKKEEQRDKRARQAKTKRRGSGLRRLAVLLVSVCALFFVTLGVTKLAGAAGNTPPAASGAARSTVEDVATSSTASQAQNGVQPATWNHVGPVEQTINNMELVMPDYRMITLPENGRVDVSYFNSVTFVGDSITTGLELYTSVGLPNATYCAYRSVSPKAIYDGQVLTKEDGTKEIPLDALRDSKPDNVYILMGANAMVFMKDDLLIEQYEEMVRHIQDALDPAVGIYVQSITPVRPDNTNGFTMARIDELNNRLADMAYRLGVYFLDLNEPLAGDDGYLREDFASTLDGLHLTPEGYAAWVDYLVTHTAYHPRNPYLEGSPYYTPALPEPEPDPAEGE